MNRTSRRAILGLVAVLAAVGPWTPLTALAQPAGRIWRVGWLQPSASPNPGHASFRRAMAELGYLDDVIEPRDTRPKLIAALEMLRNKRQTMPAKKHGNPPL